MIAHVLVKHQEITFLAIKVVEGSKDLQRTKIIEEIEQAQTTICVSLGHTAIQCLQSIYRISKNNKRRATTTTGKKHGANKEQAETSKIPNHETKSHENMDIENADIEKKSDTNSIVFRNANETE